MLKTYNHAIKTGIKCFLRKESGKDNFQVMIMQIRNCN